MKLKAIKMGQWYETTLGRGLALRVGGTYPPSVQMEITAPFPRGRVNVRPRDVLRAIEPPQAPPNQNPSR